MGDILHYGDMAITRPPRCTYPMEELQNTYEIPGYGTVTRYPISFPNNRGNIIVGSYYAPNEPQDEPSCVLYLHGNASCQLEGTFLIPFLVPVGISVCCIDFNGCGHSGGDRISLGYLEKDDVASAITYLQVHFNVQKIALWGRSMGAATVFFALENEQKIEGAVADSPFASLPQLVKELSGEMGVPACLNGIAVWALKNHIEDSSGFDIRKCCPIEYAPCCSAPIFIIHGRRDTFINVHHAQDLYAAYGGEKRLEVVRGNHNSERPYSVTADALMFLAGCLGKTLVIEKVEAAINAGGMHFAGLMELMADLTDES